MMLVVVGKRLAITLLLALMSAPLGLAQLASTQSTAGIGAVRNVTSGSTDTATTADSTINWLSASGAAKTETLPGCTASISGIELWIKDSQGDAHSNPIALTPSSGTIDGAASVSIDVNFGAGHVRCDGSHTNWMMQ